MRSGGASRTAVFVCQGRAVADGRLAVGRFSDPVARHLLCPDELELVDAARAASTDGPVDTGRRWQVESVRACAEVVVPRTVVIDEAVTRAVTEAGGRPAIDQVVLIGAGLDGRPWRLAVLGTTTVFSVDHPATHADAQARAADLTPVPQRLVPCPIDLTAEPLGPALEAAGHRSSAPTVWVWEGVVPYLRKSEVAATADALASRSASGSVLVVNYQTPSVVTRLGRFVAGLLSRFAQVPSVTADEPWRSLWTPQAVRRLLAARGFSVDRDVDLLDVARQLGSPSTHSGSLRNGRVAVAHFTGDPPRIPSP